MLCNVLGLHSKLSPVQGFKSRKLKGIKLCGLQLPMVTVKMNLEFLENVCQFLPSLEWCTDKRAEADEMLTAALPLNTLAQPDAAAKHTHTAHTDYTPYTLERKQICFCLLTNSYSPAPTLARSIISCTLRHENAKRFLPDSPLSYSSFWCRGVSWFSRWQHRAQSTGGSCEAGRPHLCQTPAFDPTAAQNSLSPPSLSPPYRAVRCHGTDRPEPQAGGETHIHSSD